MLVCYGCYEANVVLTQSCYDSWVYGCNEHNGCNEHKWFAQIHMNVLG